MTRILAPLTLLAMIVPVSAFAADGTVPVAGSVLDGQTLAEKSLGEIAEKAPRATRSAPKQTRGGPQAAQRNAPRAHGDSRDHGGRSTHRENHGSDQQNANGQPRSQHDGGGHRTADQEHADRHDAARHEDDGRESAEHGHANERHADASARHADASRAERHAEAGHHADHAHHAADHRAANAHHAAVVAHRHDVAARDAWAARHHAHGWGYARPWYPGRPHYWYHGVFVYGPPPVVVTEPVAASRGTPTEASHAAPKRAVNHEGDLSVGIRGGSYVSGYKNGDSFGDAGLGLAARYRPIEPLGLELAWTYHDQSWTKGSERIEQPLTASVELFAFPWTKVNPYALAGVTVTQRNVDEHFDFGPTYTSNQTLWGPTGGVGIEFGLGKQASLNFDARWTGYVNKPVDDPSVAGAFQGNMGLNVYF